MQCMHIVLRLYVQISFLHIQLIPEIANSHNIFFQLLLKTKVGLHTMYTSEIERDVKDIFHVLHLPSEMC